MEKSKDWFARILGVLGLVLGLTSLGWQVFTYHDSSAERVLVRLSMRVQYHRGEDTEASMKHAGDLTAEIVNIGQHSLYLRDVSLALEPQREWGPGDDPRNWDFAPIKSPKSSNPLEPGAAAYFRIQKFDFGKHPLNSAEDPARQEDYVVIVRSNKAEIFRSPAPFEAYEFYENLPR